MNKLTLAIRLQCPTASIELSRFETKFRHPFLEKEPKNRIQRFTGITIANPIE
jgi:hypothetical protein